jgi:glutathione synthase/RimK-type ligase-like ATP-grasp enzyme
LLAFYGVTTCVALVTCAEYPDLCEDDRLLIPALERRGCRAGPALWDDRAQRWGEYDVVVPRSTWDYHRRLPEFLHWLDRLERASVPIWNRMPTLRWSIDKRYLRALEAAGIPVTPTAWVSKGSAVTLRDLTQSVHSDALVVKPAVSASAFETWRTDGSPSREDEARFARTVEHRDLMIQPFLPVFQTDGEISQVFIDGTFSHAVRKRPRPGDFRVQEEHGGTAEHTTVAGDLVRQAARALAVAPEATLYARVDGVVINGGLVVTELELVEPRLYFGWERTAPDRFADALLAAIRAP